MKAFFLLACFIHSITSYGSCPTIPPKVFVDPKNLPFDKVENFLSEQVKNVPGFVGVAVLNGEIVWSKGWGKRDPFAASSPPPSIYDWVRIASLSKTFTSLLAHVLHDKEMLNLDDTIKKHWPQFEVKNPYPNAKGITLRECASHTSGLIRDGYYPHSPTPTPDVGMAALAQTYLLRPQYTRFHYSNEAFNLLGYTLQHANNNNSVPYTKLMHDKVLAPLGLMNATFTVDQNTIAHMAVGSRRPGVRAAVTQFDWGNPCGGLITSAHEIAQYMISIMDEDKLSKILSSSVRNEWLTPAILLRDGTYAIGYPWEMNYTSGMWTYSKQGEEPGYRSSMTFVPDLGLGMFTVATISDVADMDGTVWTVPSMDMLIQPTRDAMFANQPPAVLPKNAQDYVGTYGPSNARGRVYIADTLYLMAEQGGTTWNLTVFQPDPKKPPVADVFHGLILHPHEQCRFLDDGSNEALAYFKRDKTGKVNMFWFAGDEFGRVSP